MTREELLLAFERFSNEKLSKLLTIGDSILTPLEKELTAVDFGAMVEEVFKEGGLADRFFPEWTDRSGSDFGRFLVELFALFSDKDFFYINHFARESFVLTAECYRSLVQFGLEQGYEAPGNDSAVGIVQMTFEPGGEEVVKRGSIEIGNEVIGEQVYTNEEFTIPASSIGVTVMGTFRHGRVRRVDGYFNGHSIYVGLKGIARGTIRLKMDGEDWVEVLSFKDGTPMSKHFRVVYDEEGRAEILFAPKGLGWKPKKGKFYEVEVIQGGGYIGDALAGTATKVLKKTTKRELVGFTHGDFTGGNAQLEKERLREVIIGRNRAQRRVVTPEDAEYFCKELEFVEKVYAEAFSYFLYVYVLPKNAPTLMTSGQVQQVINKLEGRLLMGYDLVVSDPVYVAVTMRVTVYVLMGYSKSGAYLIAERVVEDYLNPMKGGRFGEGVNRGRLTKALLQNIIGANNVVFEVLHRKGTPQPAEDLVFKGNEVVDWWNSEITINVVGGI